MFSFLFPFVHVDRLSTNEEGSSPVCAAQKLQVTPLKAPMNLKI